MVEAGKHKRALRNVLMEIRMFCVGAEEPPDAQEDLWIAGGKQRGDDVRLRVFLICLVNVLRLLFARGRLSRLGLRRMGCGLGFGLGFGLLPLDGVVDLPSVDGDPLWRGDPQANLVASDIDLLRTNIANSFCRLVL